ncbi:MAG: helix-turn-helix domain-containing protein, partial [Trebonia sp.]
MPAVHYPSVLGRSDEPHWSSGHQAHGAGTATGAGGDRAAAPARVRRGCRGAELQQASQRLFITQPALSRQIRGLERLVGCDLFRRST